MDVSGRADACAASATRHMHISASAVVVICEAREEGRGGEGCGRKAEEEVCRSTSSYSILYHDRGSLGAQLRRSWAQGPRARAREGACTWLFRKVLLR
jgi:hypothetical protein